MQRRRTAIALLCTAPVVLAAALASSPLTPERVNAVKVIVASVAAALLAWGAWLGRTGRPQVQRRLRSGLLLALGLLGGLCGWNLLRFHYPGWIQLSDTYHYYVGSKYFRELGYTRLYACTALADAEAGISIRNRPLRDLASNRIEAADAVLADPGRCTGHFAAARWRAFQRDVAWFREHVPSRVWARMQLDHGYNATPVWGLVGAALANSGPASETRILALSLLDPLLLLAMWGCAAWAFGWRASCVALVYWGTNYPSPFGWTGGAYLRQGWLATAVVGICLLRRAHPVAGGFLLAWSALLRLFPALLLAGIGLGAIARMARTRSLALSASERRIAAGAALALASLVPLSALAAGGPGAWTAFVENGRVHLATPLLNHMGLRTLLSYDADARYAVARESAANDPTARWKALRRQTFAARAPLFWLLLAAYAALVARAADRRREWVAAVLGIGLVPVAAELTGYYAAILLGFGFLWGRRESIGAALCALSATGWLAAHTWHWTDEILTWMSLLTVVFVGYATLAMARAPREEAGAADG